METIWIISQRLASSNSTYYASLKVTECVGKLFIMRNSWKLKLLVFGAKNAKNWIITSIIIPQRKCPRIIKCVRWESFFFELNDDVVLQQCVSHSELIQSFRVFFQCFEQNWEVIDCKYCVFKVFPLKKFFAIYFICSWLGLRAKNTHSDLRGKTWQRKLLTIFIQYSRDFLQIYLI